MNKHDLKEAIYRLLIIILEDNEYDLRLDEILGGEGYTKEERNAVKRELGLDAE